MMPKSPDKITRGDIDRDLLKALDKIADMTIEVMERHGRRTMYFYAGWPEDSGARTVGFFNTAGAGIVLDRLCDDALKGHIDKGCAHCNAVADAIAAAQRAYHAALAGKTRECK